ncbi:hypothetical protein E2C01_030469 [Portunus trituberculatus]|uniref:Uncharacterized protein n=1 Tax=Portunus trituberculatus TaxID=210409 RepID=A0A5B7EUX7_PORTR|nr:hypothetical protein [Portunus trituberculatus]
MSVLVKPAKWEEEGVVEPPKSGNHRTLDLPDHGKFRTIDGPQNTFYILSLHYTSVAVTLF